MARQLIIGLLLFCVIVHAGQCQGKSHAQCTASVCFERIETSHELVPIILICRKN